MKKLFAFMLAVMLTLTLTVYAAGDGGAIESDVVELTADNFGTCVASSKADDLTWGDGTVSSGDIPLFGMHLPKPVALGETVVVTIKGTSEGDFRVWLLAESEKTFSNQYKMSENNYEDGTFDRAIELTAADFDGAGLSEALDICFKGPVYGENLHNLTLESVKIYYCTMEEYLSNEVDFSEADAKAAEALAKADALYDKLDDAAAIEAGVAELENDYITYLEAFVALDYDGAIKAVNELYDKIDDLRDEALLKSLSEYIEKAESALKKADEANGDVNVMKECLNEAKEAAEYVSSKALMNKKTRTKANELNAAVTELAAKIENASASSTPADNGNTTENNDAKTEGGCGSVMGASAAIIAITSVFGCAIIRKER